MSAHQKHAVIARPQGGKIHRNEFAFIGAPCGIIQSLTIEISKELGHFRVGYVDADHGSDGVEKEFFYQYTDKIGHHQISFDNANIEYSFRSLFNDSDLVLINGNHFLGDKQIVLINEKKKESLHKKLDRLTNVLMFVLDEGITDIHDFLKEDFANVPMVSISDVAQVADAIKELVKKPVLKGLVLAGGKSQRMGENKGNLNYHGKAQKDHTADLLSPFCEEVYLSLREDDGTESYPVVTDKFMDLGPYGGILSAFKMDPNAAWLTVATDIPLLDQEAIAYLIQNRDTSRLATCFHNPNTNFPEPLITIWEPRAYPHLLSFLSMGYSCPRKVLINSDIHEINLDRIEVLKNANTPEEKEEILGIING